MPNAAPGIDGKSLFPLSNALAGDCLVITALDAGKGLGRRLADLGLPVGTEIGVVHRQFGGRLVVSRDTSRVALGAGMSKKIMVRRAEQTARAEAREETEE